MVYIITSKTRRRIMSQPSEATKMINERRMVTFAKHGVEKITPINGMNELEVHKELDQQGNGIKEAMLANQERQRDATKIKQKKLNEQKAKTIAESIKKREQRDRSKGIKVKK